MICSYTMGAATLWGVPDNIKLGRRIRCQVPQGGGVEEGDGGGQEWDGLGGVAGGSVGDVDGKGQGGNNIS